METTFKMVFLKNEDRLSPVFMNANILEFKQYDGVIYAFDDLDEGFLKYEELVRETNNFIDWESIRP